MATIKKVEDVVTTSITVGRKVPEIIEETTHCEKSGISGLGTYTIDFQRNLSELITTVWLRAAYDRAHGQDGTIHIPVNINVKSHLYSIEYTHWIDFDELCSYMKKRQDMGDDIARATLETAEIITFVILEYCNKVVYNLFTKMSTKERKEKISEYKIEKID